MFRLIKLAFYGVLGYSIYQFVRGFLYGEDMARATRSESAGRASGRRELNRALDENAVRTNVTGAGRGERIMTAEPSGESVPHIVGRGVIHR
jgi:hypothetical protein